MADRILMRGFTEMDNFAINCVQQSVCLSFIVDKSEEMTGIRGESIVKGFIRVLLVLIVLSYGPTIFINTLVVLYPAYQSFLAIEYEDIDETKRWMKYWIVYGMFITVEKFGETFIWWSPGYCCFKVFFFFRCLYPKDINVSVMIYENYLRPLFLQHRETIDNILELLGNATNPPHVD